MQQHNYPAATAPKVQRPGNGVIVIQGNQHPAADNRCIDCRRQLPKLEANQCIDYSGLLQGLNCHSGNSTKSTSCNRLSCKRHAAGINSSAAYAASGCASQQLQLCSTPKLRPVRPIQHCCAIMLWKHMHRASAGPSGRLRSGTPVRCDIRQLIWTPYLKCI